MSGVREPDFATFARICRALAMIPNEALGFEARPERPGEAGRLRERSEAAVEVMDIPTLRTAAALLNVLASKPSERESG